MEKFCNNCYHAGYCLIKDPINIRGKSPNKPDDCLAGTCLEGEICARKSMYGKVRFISTNLGEQRLYRFGSRHKPTDRSNRFARYVNPDGLVFFQDLRDGNPIFTGQVIDLY